jgi:hypothetical protein
LAFGDKPLQIRLGHGGSILFGYEDATYRRWGYLVLADVYPNARRVPTEWRERAAYRRSGFAIVRVRNVVILTSLPGGTLGVRRHPFSVPRPVGRLAERLRHTRPADDPNAQTA